MVLYSEDGYDGRNAAYEAWEKVDLLYVDICQPDVAGWSSKWG